MRLVGKKYLSKLMTPIISSIYNSKTTYEVDPSKLEKGQDIKKNLSNLLAKVEEVTQRIFNSYNDVP
jgi:hypothetical protein